MTLDTVEFVISDDGTRKQSAPKILQAGVVQRNTSSWRGCEGALLVRLWI